MFFSLGVFDYIEALGWLGPLPPPLLAGHKELCAETPPWRKRR